jgi:hypothetical protein
VRGQDSNAPKADKPHWRRISLKLSLPTWSETRRKQQKMQKVADSVFMNADDKSVFYAQS